MVQTPRTQVGKQSPARPRLFSKNGWILRTELAESTAVPPAVDRIRAAPDAASLSQLERRLDSMPFRISATVAARWQTRARPAARARSALFRAAVGRPASPPGLLQALATAAAGGALESAEQILGELTSRGDAHTLADARSVTLVIETLLMLGKREHARELAQSRAALLSTSDAGLGILELTGIDTARDWLPNGRPHLFRLSRRVESGQLDAAGLARLLETSRRAWFRSPELLLLFVGALIDAEPERATRFLNRYLRLHDIPPCEGLSAAGGANVLERLRFSSSAAARIDERRLVSVIVAAHESARTIEYAVASLLRQSYRNLEILVGDDASGDGTLQVLRSRFGAEPRVRLFRSSKNQGAYNLRNSLAANARGELLTFHDADDFAFPNRIARQVAQLARPRVGACIGNFLRIRPNASVVFFKDQRASRMCAVSLMLPRATFEQIGPFRSARFGADHELTAKLHHHLEAKGGVSRLRSPVLLALASPGSATRAAGGESLEDGYRSAARRAYGELVFALRQPGGRAPTHDQIDARLRATNNYQESGELLKA